MGGEKVVEDGDRAELGSVCSGRLGVEPDDGVEVEVVCPEEVEVLGGR